MTELIWQYEQRTGKLTYNGDVVGIGYSGNGDGLNNPAMESTPFVGPIPQGWWRIEGPPFSSSKHGPFCLRLTAYNPDAIFGRTDFLMHGDKIDAVGQHLASQGCIIMSRDVREKVWDSHDLVLQVVPGEIK